MEQLGFYVCVADLEDELIRSLGTAAVEQFVDAQGDLESFRTFQKQTAWRGRSTEEQLRRFFGTHSRRKIQSAPGPRPPCPVHARGVPAAIAFPVEDCTWNRSGRHWSVACPGLLKLGQPGVPATMIEACWTAPSDLTSPRLPIILSAGDGPRAAAGRTPHSGGRP